MRKILTIIGILLFSSGAFASGYFFENKLQDFSTDGCSRFPDGIPLTDEAKWRNCCISHDIAYWQGGTAEQRKVADDDLETCVAKTGEQIIGSAMYWGVRVGGYSGLPTSWHWGYGWTIERDESPLTAEEKKQVEEKLKKIPHNLNELQIKPAPILRDRNSVTGNNCLDIAAKEIQVKIGRSFKIIQVEEEDSEKVDGYWKTLTVKTDAREESFHFTFQLLSKTACTDPMNELLARGRIRLMNSR